MGCGRRECGACLSAAQVPWLMGSCSGGLQGHRPGSSLTARQASCYVVTHSPSICTSALLTGEEMEAHCNMYRCSQMYSGPVPPESCSGLVRLLMTVLLGVWPAVPSRSPPTWHGSSRAQASFSFAEPSQHPTGTRLSFLRILYLI